MVNKCPKCETLNPRDVTFCKNCREALPLTTEQLMAPPDGWLRYLAVALAIGFGVWAWFGGGQ